MAADNLKAAGANGASVYVRVNGWHTEYTNDDLEAVVQPGLDGITLPKTRNADDVKRLDWKISELEARRGIPAGTVKIAVLLETAEGIMNAYSICTASPVSWLPSSARWTTAAICASPARIWRRSRR